ncbi:MAG: hypothetical protein U1G07_00945 [Verrucomicrobiota bacterium]
MVTSLLALWLLLAFSFFFSLAYLARQPIPPAETISDNEESTHARCDLGITIYRSTDRRQPNLRGIESLN